MVKEIISDSANRPKEILHGVSEELKKRAEENPFRVSQVSSDTRFSVLRFIKLLPKWYSKKTWTFMLSFWAVLTGIVIFSFAKFGIIPGIASWVVCWGTWIIWWNRWWKKNSADFLINMTNVIEKCVVDKDGNPVFSDGN